MGKCNKSLSIKLQKLRNHATRILTFSSYDAKADDVLSLISLLDLAGKIVIVNKNKKTATMVYKSLNALAPDYLKSMLTDRSAISTYSYTGCVSHQLSPSMEANICV